MTPIKDTDKAANIPARNSEDHLMSVVQHHRGKAVLSFMLLFVLPLAIPVNVVLTVSCYFGIFGSILQVLDGNILTGCITGACLIGILRFKPKPKKIIGYFSKTKATADREIAGAAVNFIEEKYSVKFDDMDIEEVALFTHQFLRVLDEQGRMDVQFYLESQPEEQKTGALVFSKKDYLVLRDESGKELTPTAHTPRR